jgi:hypothetical protein
MKFAVKKAGRTPVFSFAMDSQKVHYIRVGPSLASAAMRSAKDGLFGS